MPEAGKRLKRTDVGHRWHCRVPCKSNSGVSPVGGRFPTPQQFICSQEGVRPFMSRPDLKHLFTLSQGWGKLQPLAWS